jgi:hypothetical protein
MAIHATCDNCGYEYKLKDELAGRQVTCKICQATFVVPAAPQPPPAIETAVYRHAPRSKDFTPACGDEDNIIRIGDHIERYIGPVEMVFHEIVSDLIHIDLHWVKPTADKPYHTLITSGMSDLPMTVPEGAEPLRFAELMISLPPEWPMDMDSFKDESHYWPLRWLKMLARFPHEYETWLCFGHTVPNADPPQPYAANTDLCCALLLGPILPDEEFGTLEVDGEKSVHFFSFVPIYREEMEFKMAEGVDPLLERFSEHQVSELLDVRRINVCGKAKKKGWWF